MSDMSEAMASRLIASFPDLPLRAKKMFGCLCIYCSDQPVGWVSNGRFDLKHRPCCRDLLAGNLAVYREDLHEVPIPETAFGTPWLRDVLIKTA